MQSSTACHRYSDALYRFKKIYIYIVIVQLPKHLTIQLLQSPAPSTTQTTLWRGGFNQSLSFLPTQTRFPVVGNCTLFIKSFFLHYSCSSSTNTSTNLMSNIPDNDSKCTTTYNLKITQRPMTNVYLLITTSV